MAWAVQYVPERETLVVVVTGPVSDDEVRDLTGRAISLISETHATRVLGDFRGMQSGPSFGAVFWLVNGYADRGVPRQTRIALVHSREQHAVELAQFYENVCFNRQYEARAFSDRAQAEAWLHSGATA